MKLQWRGISLACKCRCCEKPGIESRLHLFVNGEAARKVWMHFARWFPHMPTFGEEGENIDLRLRWWQRHLGVRSKLHICVIIPCLIFWFIWIERNENVYREKVFEGENVIKRVNMQLRNLVLARLIGPEQWRGCCPRLEVMTDQQISGPRTRKVGRVQWRPPDPSWIKLNVDGAYLQLVRRAGGGGTIRDSDGEILAAFAAELKGSSGLAAEVLALLMGLALAKQHGERIWIEMDAQIVVRWLDSGHLGAAKVCTTLARIRKELEGVTWKVSHIFREGNRSPGKFLIFLEKETKLRTSLRGLVYRQG